MFASLPLSDLAARARARALYSGARDHRDVAALLEPYGYDADDYEHGLDLVEDLDDHAADQMREYAEQYAATAKASAALAAVEVLYARHRRLARLRHRRDSAGYRALALAGRIPDSDAGLVAAAGTFYRALTDDPALGDGIRGLTPAAVADGRARVETARVAMDTQARETGEAQIATRLRDDTVARLRAHAAELAGTAKEALADAPQLREALGLMERGS